MKKMKAEQMCKDEEILRLKEENKNKDRLIEAL